MVGPIGRIGLMRGSWGRRVGVVGVRGRGVGMGFAALFGRGRGREVGRGPIPGVTASFAGAVAGVLDGEAQGAEFGDDLVEVGFVLL